MAPRRRTNFPAGSTAAPLLAALLVVALPVAAQQTPPAARTDTAQAAVRRDTTRRDSAVTPPADQARGMDAEIRVALFELLNDQDVAALTRLRALQGVAGAGAGGEAGLGGLKGPADLQFLLAQGYYRLGLDSAFRGVAQPLAGSSRYAGVLRGQLLLEAYRRGDYARARELAGQMAQGEARGLAALVLGLASYQAGDNAAARSAFQQAQAAGAPYAAYAQYMDALTLLKADTTQTAAALTALEQAATSAQGTGAAEFADQVRLTAAQLAYEAERFPDAVRIADQIRPTGGLAAQALLTRAWALYKQDDVAAAGEAFARFAAQYPQLPERDEARLMAAQAVLQQGRTEDAGRLFRAIADSMSAEQGTMRSASGTSADAARALVQARAAGLLFLEEPAAGKSLALQDAAGSDATALLSVVRDTVVSTAQVAPPEMVSLEDVSARYATLQSTGLSRRVLFAPASATTARRDYAARASALYDADVGAALARRQLDEQIAAQMRQLAMLRQLRDLVGAERASFAQLEARLSAARDSLARLATSLDAARTSLTQMLQAQVNMTRTLAQENLASIDTVRRTLAGAATPDDETILAAETRTAQLYAETASLIEQGIGGAISRHPTFALADSVRARGERMGQALAQARALADSTQAIILAEIQRLESGDSERVRLLRTQLAAAESRRTQAEQQVVAVVQRELTARAGELLAGLQRDTEAAEFGTASASFFQAIDADRRGTTGGGASGAMSQRAPGTGTTPATAGTNGSTPAAAPAATNPSLSGNK